jgi:hypothetical protein
MRRAILVILLSSSFSVVAMAQQRARPSPDAPYQQQTSPSSYESQSSQSKNGAGHVTHSMSEPDSGESRRQRADRRRRTIETNHAAAGSNGGYHDNSTFCGYVRQHLGTAIAAGLDNRDGLITAMRRGCR